MTVKKPKNLLQKLKEKISDKEEQFEYISVAVRLLVVFWSGLLVTSNYLPKIPGITTGEKTGHHISGLSAGYSFVFLGLEQAKKRCKNNDKVASNEGMVQTIRVITPIKNRRC